MVDWSITITDGQGGTHTPHIYSPPGTDHPQRVPEANGVPTLEFGVKPLSGSDSWFDSKFENCSISVTVDENENGSFTAAPYDTLLGPKDDSDEGPVVLRAEGGEELQQRVSDSIDVRTTHNAASYVVSNYTSYGEDIPTPSSNKTDNVTILDRSTTGNLTTSDFEKFPESSPVHITSSGYLTAHQTLQRTSSTSALSSEGDSFTFDFTTNYSIPKDRVGVAFLTSVGSEHVGIEMDIDGTVVGSIKPRASFSAPEWVTRSGSDDRLPPGSHTLTVAVSQDTHGGVDLNGVTPDMVAVYDAKWVGEYSFGNDDTSPELYPDTLTVPLAEPFVTRSVRGLSVTNTTWTGDAGAWLFSNGNTTTYTSGVDANFASHGPVADVLVQLSGYNQGQNFTELQGFELQADLETMPLTVNKTLEGTVAEVLTELADDLRGDFIWTFDTDSSGNELVRFVRAGTRTTTNNDVERYSVTKLTENLVDEVKVLGGTVETSERVRAVQGSAVDLTKADLADDSETVTSPDRDQPYERGTHYTMDYSTGTITAESSVPSGLDPIPNNSLVTVTYQFEPSATATVSSPGSPKRTEVTPRLPLRSDRACRLAAQEILDVLSTPGWDASVDLRGNLNYSVVTDLVASQRMPASNLEVIDATGTPAGLSLRLENRQSASDVIGSFETQLSQIAKFSRG